MIAIVIITVVASILTAIISAVFLRGNRVGLAVALVGAASFAVPYTIYWAPVWIHSSYDQYSLWAPFVIGTSFFFGILFGGIALYISKRLWPKR